MNWLAHENYAVGDLKQRCRGTQKAEWTEPRQENGHPARDWQATRKVWWAVKQCDIVNATHDKVGEMLPWENLQNQLFDRRRYWRICQSLGLYPYGPIGGVLAWISLPVS